MARGAGFGGQFGMREEAERVEAMVDGDDDDPLRRQPAAVVTRLRAGTDDEAAAVDPEQHRQVSRLARRGRSPDVEIEAILGNAGYAGVDVVEDDALQRVPAVFARRTHARPGQGRLRRPPPQCADGRRGKRYAFEAAHAIGVFRRNCEVAAFDGDGLVGHGGVPESGERDYRSSKLHRASRALLPLAGEGAAKPTE